MTQKVVPVAIGILVKKQNGTAQVLITRRPKRMVLGDYWEFPGGKIEPNETPQECLAREFLEELGLTIQAGEPLNIIEHQYEHGFVRLHPFYCTGEGNRPPQNIEVSEHRWVGPNELCRYRFPPANHALIEELAAALSAPFVMKK